MKKLLLHVCCGPCAIIAIERLTTIYDVVLYFSNSNIFPQEEYQKRLDSTKKVAELYKKKIMEDNYDQKEWLDKISGYEDEPEHGKRCAICIDYRLERTAYFARQNKFDAFATTLTTGPQKNAKLINIVGNKLSKKYSIEYIESNFKKRNGFKRTVEVSKKHGLYRQNYCGCKFSIRK
ncbi:MAG: epoxyqueuosine reductase QueH [Candidatus Helarchaeota archaeon]